MSRTSKNSRPSYADRKAARFQRRVELWEKRLQSPPPPRFLHRALITITMMVGMIALLGLLVTSPGTH